MKILYYMPRTINNLKYTYFWRRYTTFFL